MDILETKKASSAIGPYSQAIVHQGILYSSGQIAIDPSTGKFLDVDIQTQTQQVLKNLDEVLLSGGSDRTKVLKTTVYLRDMNDYAQMNEVYASYFSDHAPARSAVQVAKLPLGAKVEIECIARVG